MRRIGFIGLLLATLFGSFFVSLSLLDNLSRSHPNLADDKRPDAEKLGDYTVRNFGDLVEAAVGIGMHRSGDLRGVVDEINRINENEVAMRGWLADPTGDSKTLEVLVFVAGKKTAMTQTKGERPDVAKAIKLTDGAEKNVAFQLTFNCRAGDDVVTAGLGSDRQYFWLSTKRCP
jgi:hypothetical protein